MNTALEVVAEAIDQNYDEDRYLPVYPEDGSRCVDSAAARAVLAALREHWTSDPSLTERARRRMVSSPDFSTSGIVHAVIAALFEEVPVQ